MKKERVTASKKTITKAETVIDPGVDLPNFSAVSDVDLENLNLSIAANIKDLLATLIQQIREIRDFVNLRTKCKDPKPNFYNDLSDIICNKDLVVENEILKIKLEEADKKNTFLRDEVKDLTILLIAKIQTSCQNLKTKQKNACSKKTLIHNYNHNLASNQFSQRLYVIQSK